MEKNETNLASHRRKISTALLTTLTRANALKDLKITGIDGSKPIVIAFGDESIGEVFTRVSWSAGFANLFIVNEDEKGNHKISRASIMPPASSLVERTAEPLKLVSAESSISMLVELAGQQAGNHAFNISFPGATLKVGSVEQVEELTTA